MNQPGRYAAPDGSFAKSASSAAVRGGALIAVAIVLGFILLRWGFDGGDSDAEVAAPVDDGATEEPAVEEDPSTTDPATTDPAGGDAPVDGEGDGTGNGTTTSDPVVVDDPATVDVVVLNGTGVPGLAGTRGEALGAVGYTWTAGNAATTPTEASNVFYAEGYADEAKAVAEALSGGAAVLAEAPADQGSLASVDHAEATAAADVVVVLGADQALS